MNSTSIELPQALLDEEAEDSLRAFFAHNLCSALQYCLDLEVWQFDERASVYRVELCSIAVQADELVIDYRVCFGAYYGCSDQDYTDSDIRVIRGRINGSLVTFPNFVPPERRSTADEL